MSTFTQAFAEALDDIAAGRYPRTAELRAADVDAGEFEEIFAYHDHLLEIDLDMGIAYWHSPNEAGDIDPVHARLSVEQIAAARTLLA